MPLISIRLAAGRTDDELRALVREVSEAAASALELPVQRVTVHLFELAPTQIARGGRLVAEAGA